MLLNPRKWLIRTGIILPVLFVCYYVYKYGIIVPYWDQWEFVPLFEKFNNHTLTLNDLWAQHNEHRIFFPKLLMLILARISSWNLLLELFTNIIFACLSLFLLFSLLDNTQEPKKNSMLKIVISLLVFSMIQFENWSTGWQITICLYNLSIIFAIWSINKWQSQMRGLILAIVSAIIANYSFGSGILVWPSVLFMLVLQKKWKLKHIVIWLIAGFVTVASYYYKHTGSSFNSPMTFFIKNPLVFAKYVLGYLGAPLAHKINYANLVTLILFVIIVLSIFDIWRLDRNRLGRMIPWFTFLLFVMMSAFITGLGRVGLGIEQALSSRYTIISNLFVISAFVLLYNSIILNLEKKQKASPKDIVFILVVSIAFCVAYISNYEYGAQQMKKTGTRINSAGLCLKDIDNATDDELKQLYPSPEIIRQRMKILKEMGIEFDAGN